MAPAGGEGVKSHPPRVAPKPWEPGPCGGPHRLRWGWKDHVCTCAHLQVRVSLPCSYEAVTGLSLPKPPGIAPSGGGSPSSAPRCPQVDGWRGAFPVSSSSTAERVTHKSNS